MLFPLNANIIPGPSSPVATQGTPILSRYGWWHETVETTTPKEENRPQLTRGARNPPVSALGTCPKGFA